MAQAHGNLGNALKDNGQLDDAIAAYRQAIPSAPTCLKTHGNLGVALKDKGQLMRPSPPIARPSPRARLCRSHCNLAIALKDKGQLDELFRVSPGHRPQTRLPKPTAISAIA